MDEYNYSLVRPTNAYFTHILFQTLLMAREVTIQNIDKEEQNWEGNVFLYVASANLLNYWPDRLLLNLLVIVLHVKDKMFELGDSY